MHSTHNARHAASIHDQAPPKKERGGLKRIGRAIVGALAPTRIETTGSSAQLSRIKGEIVDTLTQRGVVGQQPFGSNLNRAGSITHIEDDGHGEKALTHIVLAGDSAFGVIARSHSSGRLTDAQLVLLPLGAHQEDSLGHHRTPRQMLLDRTLNGRSSAKPQSVSVGSAQVEGDSNLALHHFQVSISDEGYMSIATRHGITRDPVFVLDYRGIQEINGGRNSVAMDLAVLLNSDTNLWNPDLTGVDLNR